jgi:hypothetical protein
MAYRQKVPVSTDVEKIPNNTEPGTESGAKRERYRSCRHAGRTDVSLLISLTSCRGAILTVVRGRVRINF